MLMLFRNGWNFIVFSCDKQCNKQCNHCNHSNHLWYPNWDNVEITMPYYIFMETLPLWHYLWDNEEITMPYVVAMDTLQLWCHKWDNGEKTMLYFTAVRTLAISRMVHKTMILSFCHKTLGNRNSQTNVLCHYQINVTIVTVLCEWFNKSKTYSFH